MCVAEIAVIIPAYNAETTIQQTIASVLAQTFTGWQIILINDGSTDQTVSAVEAINDDRINIFSFENAGHAAARNRGLELANSKFLAFLDADDLWTPDKLESQRKALFEYPQAGLAYSWTIFLDEQGYIQYRQKPVMFDGDVHQELLIQNFLMCGSTPLIRREAAQEVGKFDTALFPVEDWDYWLRVAARYPFTIVPRHQTYYCKSGGSTSSNLERYEQKIVMAIDKAYGDAPAHMQHNKQQSLANAYYYLASQFLNYQQDADGLGKARDSLFKALRLYPRLMLNFDTYLLGTKLLAMSLLPGRSANYGVRAYRKMRTRINRSRLIGFRDEGRN